MRFLRYGTDTTVIIGPLVNKYNPYILVDSLTDVGDEYTKTDCYAYKEGSVTSPVELELTTAGNGVNDFVYESNGHWSLELTTTDTGTLGALRVSLVDVDNTDNYLPFHEDFMVLPQNIYDWFIADSGSFTDMATVVAKLCDGLGSAASTRLHGVLSAGLSKDASTPSGQGTFNPATDSVEAIRERVDKLAGTGFVSSTDSQKALRSAFDTSVAPSVVGSSAMSGEGFLSDVVSMVRTMVDEPDTNVKYTDTQIVRQIQAAMSAVVADINTNVDHPILVRHDVTLVSGQQTYQLPFNVAEVWRVAKVNSTSGVVEWEVWPSNEFAMSGTGFSIEGNTLRLLSNWKSTETLQILYVPTGEPLIHYGTASAAAAGTITFDATPTDGTLDTRANAYVGCLVRVLSYTTSPVVQERLITAYDNTTLVATINEDWDATPDAAILYEVLPWYSELIKDVVSQHVALDLLANAGDMDRIKTLTSRLQVKIRALRQYMEKKNSRFPGHFEGDTADNPARSVWGG